jgi:hypothetical protein
MPGGRLHVLELGAVLERCGDEGGAHRMRRVTAIEPERGRVFPDHAVDRVGVHPSAFVLALAVMLERPEQGARQYPRCGRRARDKPASVLPSAG